MRIISSIIPDITLKDIAPREFDNNKYLTLLSCGRQTLTNTHHTFKCIRDSESCKNYMIQVSLSGKACHTYGGKDIIVESPTCILYEPGMAQNIIRHGSDNTDTIWLHFSGFGVEDILSSLELKGITLLSSTSGLKSLLLEMIQELSFPSRNHDLLCQNLLLKFLLTLSQYAKGISNSINFAHKIAPVLNHIARNYAQPSLSIHEYAQMCYLSDSRFSHLFKEITGVTPHRYILQKRISSAENLLLSTDMKIEEVASSVGFIDPYHFSRVFKKITGMPPTTFKKNSTNS